VNAVVLNLSKRKKTDVNCDERTFSFLPCYCDHWCVEPFFLSLYPKKSKQLGRVMKEPIGNDFFSSCSSQTLPVINAWREKRKWHQPSLTLTKHMLVSKYESLSTTYLHHWSYMQWSCVVITFCIKRGWVILSRTLTAWRKNTELVT
jgi:hypothetical protein